MNRLRTGFTLVEVVVAIAIISVAIGGVMLVFVVALRHSADPQQQQQAIAIAEGYMDEILSRAYADPDGVALREASRALYDDVTDYNGLSEPPHDQDGNTITGLENYLVSVNVSEADNVLGPAGDTAPLARRIDVRVRLDPQVDTTISAYRLP